MEKYRSLYIDVVRGFAIFLVVFGHCIQYGSEYSDSYFVNPVFKFIYSFHMPLFMLISGYLFYASVNKHSFKGVCIGKLRRIFIPLFVWVTLFLIFFDTKEFCISNIHGIWTLINIYFSHLWFLWSVLFCSLVTLVIHHFFSDNLFVHFVILLYLLLLPNAYNIFYYAFMYPFFVAGYGYNKIVRMHINKEKMNIVFFLSFLLYVPLYIFFVKEDYIYVSLSCILDYSSKTLIFHQILIDFYRYLIGFVGSILILVFFRLLIPNYLRGGVDTCGTR